MTRPSRSPRDQGGLALDAGQQNATTSRATRLDLKGWALAIAVLLLILAAMEAGAEGWSAYRRSALSAGARGAGRGPTPK